MTIYYECPDCDEVHEGLPALAFSEPHYWEGIPEGERETHGRLTTETCVIDDEDYFVRGVLQIPIVGTDETFEYGVWTTLSETNFERFVELGGNLGPEPTGPFFGWFSNRVPGYPDTLNLKAMVHLQADQLRPLIVLEPTDHLLSREQHHGMTMARAKDLARAAWHPGEHEIDDTLSNFVVCEEHEVAHATYICCHLARSEADAMFSSGNPDTPWPDAWCEQCDAVLDREGDWTENAMAFADIGLVCHRCYEGLRDKLCGDANH